MVAAFKVRLVLTEPSVAPADVLLERVVGLCPVEPIPAIGLAAEARRIAERPATIERGDLLGIEVGAPHVSGPHRLSKGAAVEARNARVRFGCGGLRRQGRDHRRGGGNKDASLSHVSSFRARGAHHSNGGTALPVPISCQDRDRTSARCRSCNSAVRSAQDRHRRRGRDEKRMRRSGLPCAPCRDCDR